MPGAGIVLDFTSDNGPVSFKPEAWRAFSWQALGFVSIGIDRFFICIILGGAWIYGRLDDRYARVKVTDFTDNGFAFGLIGFFRANRYLMPPASENSTSGVLLSTAPVSGASLANASPWCANRRGRHQFGAGGFTANLG